MTNTPSAPPSKTSPETPAVKTPTTPKAKPALANSLKRDPPGRMRSWEKDRQLSPPPPPPPPPCSSASAASPPSLESKINSFLQGNPGFSMALGDVSPDGVDGTPVRDEAAGTPTQDEMMDPPGSVPESLGSSAGTNLSPTAYRSDPWDAVITPSRSNSDGAFLNSTSSHYGAVKRGGARSKDDGGGGVNARKPGAVGAEGVKGRKGGGGERRLPAGVRKASAGSDDGGLSGRREDRVKGHHSPRGNGKDSQYHRIETLVSPCADGAPIQTLGYSSQPLAGERIKTVESIRVIGRGSRRGGATGSRPGASMWYEEEEYMDAQPPSPHSVPPPLGASQGGAEDMAPSMPLPPPHHLIPHLHPPPHPFQMPYHPDSMQVPPPHLHQHPPPASPFFSPPPPIPRPPPPPIPQLPSPPPNLPSLPSAVMVGGVLVPVDRPLSLPPPVRPDGADRGGPRGSKMGPVPLMSSLLGEHLKMPRPGTVKEPFVPRHTPPIHRPGAPGVPPPLLGRVKEPMNLPLPSPPPMSSSASPSMSSSPTSDSLPPLSPTSQPSNPVPLLNLPSLRPPLQQRPPMRGRNPSRHFHQDPPMGRFRGGKRSGPPFAGGPFYPQKRGPFLPPRY